VVQEPLARTVVTGQLMMRTHAVQQAGCLGRSNLPTGHELDRGVCLWNEAQEPAEVVGLAARERTRDRAHRSISPVALLVFAERRADDALNQAVNGDPMRARIAAHQGQGGKVRQRLIKLDRIGSRGRQNLLGNKVGMQERAQAQEFACRRIEARNSSVGQRERCLHRVWMIPRQPTPPPEQQPLLGP
jgi:hypothetical protein